jgi:hypothetical protein
MSKKEDPVPWGTGDSETSFYAESKIKLTPPPVDKRLYGHIKPDNRGYRLSGLEIIALVITFLIIGFILGIGLNITVI